MARSLYLYSFSASVWRAHLGSDNAETGALLRGWIDTEFKDPAYKAWFEPLLDAILAGTVAGELATPETWAHCWLARKLVQLGQTPEAAPPVETFWHALSQTCLTGGNVDNKSIASDGPGRRIIRYLREGRPLWGERFGEGHGGASPLSDIYGWIDAGDSVEAFARVLGASAWEGYPVQARYRKKWDDEHRRALAWAQSVHASGKDVFFSSEPLQPLPPVD